MYCFRLLFPRSQARIRHFYTFLQFDPVFYTLTSDGVFWNCKSWHIQLKAIHAQEDKEAARQKVALVIRKLQAMKLERIVNFIKNSVEETLTYMDFPYEHWSRLRTNNGLERIMKEIRRRTRVVGSFPDGYSAMMLVGARLRHISTTKWGTRQYMTTCKLYEGDVR